MILERGGIKEAVRNTQIEKAYVMEFYSEDDHEFLYGVFIVVSGKEVLVKKCYSEDEAIYYLKILDLIINPERAQIIESRLNRKEQIKFRRELMSVLSDISDAIGNLAFAVKNQNAIIGRYTF